MLNKSFLFIIIVALGFSVTRAQIPDKFRNLQVLPKDIAKDKLVEIMKSFTSGLGVRCNYCHVGEEGQPLSTYKFESDTITAKLKARTMMKMTHDINSKYLSTLSEFKNDIIQVKCVTCHRGVAQPESLEDLLFNKIKADGLEEAITTYNDLYKKYYGSFAYDFRDHTLVALTEKLDEEKMFDDALAFAQINIAKYPDSGTANFGLAEVYEAKGDKENAIKYYTKALELMPRGKDFINKKIEELSK
jgi:tetratricopeptide (TPR) repeat protein